MNSEIVGGDKEVDGVEVVFGAFGEGVGSANQAADPCSQRAKPTFHVIGFSFLFATAAMGVGRKSRRISLPEVAAGSAILVVLGQRRLQVTGTLQAAVAQRVGDDLAGPSAKGHPQPERLGLVAHEAPEFIQFKHIAFLAGQQRVHEGGEILRFFPPTSASPSCNTRRRFV